MISLKKWQRAEFPFEGEVIKMEIQPLSTSAIFSFMAIDIKNPKPEQVDIIEKILNDHIRNIEGIEIDGTPVTASDIARFAPLMDLSSAIMIKLSEISTLGDRDKKNLNKQSALPKSIENPKS